MSLTLIIGSKNYSSWSLRPWMLLKHLEIEFDERVLTLYTPEFYEQIGKLNPARRVPVLLDGELRIWDSIAICEYLADKSGRGWPKDTGARAHARSVSAEMHSGFQALRFNTYGAELSPPSREYLDTALAHPPLLNWLRSAESESHLMESIDVVG